MSSSFCSSPRTLKYCVFASFHGPDVRKIFISHLRKQFDYNGITMFDDQGIERGHQIAPALTQAIGESKISVIVLSKNYASSSWCLDELLEILKCKENVGQIVMTIFYEVDPSDVRKQTGEFGDVFKKTCAPKTKESSERWSQALNYVGNIAGEHFLNWDNQAHMIEKIAKDVSQKLNATPSRDFDDMVGLDAHIMKVQSLLHLDYDGAMMVGIYGPAGIGKSTIAGALQSRLSNRFQHTCFVDNPRGSYHSGLNDYRLKLHLQEQFLSKILNQRGMKISHLGAVKEWLCDLKVLIILDDVDDLKQLEALANETTWFGPGSRIVVTTEDQELLQQHGIENTYHVDFPSRKEALNILCRYAFRKSSPHHGFDGLALRVTELCGNLPLALRVVGSSLRGKKAEKWEGVMRRLETIVGHEEIEEVLRVGYESIHEHERSLFLHIVAFFNYKDANLVNAMLANNNLDIKDGLEILANKSLIYISTNGEIVIHKLLQLVGRIAICRIEPWKRQILTDAQEICYVLENNTGNIGVSSISFDTSEIKEVRISEIAFERMQRIRFLRVYKSRDDGNNRVHIPEKINFPSSLRLLHWEAYPTKNLPATFHPEYLVELDMQFSKLEMLWKGSQPLENIKKINLSWSRQLKELPDLSYATNLESLRLLGCTSLVELPSSISYLHKLEDLMMSTCKNLEVIPIHINMASLNLMKIHMAGRRSRKRTFPYLTTDIKQLYISEDKVKEVPASVKCWSNLLSLDLTRIGNVNICTQFPDRVTVLYLSYSDIETIPECIKDAHGLQCLYLSGCKKIASLPELPRALIVLSANDCESLERVTFPLISPNGELNFTNCFKLSGEARRVIIQRSFLLRGWTCLPGSEVPKNFYFRARGSSLTIRMEGEISFSATSRFKACVIVSSCQHRREGEDTHLDLRCRIKAKSGRPINTGVVSLVLPYQSAGIQRKHLCITQFELYEEEHKLLEVASEVSFEFYSSNLCQIIECGVRILTDEAVGSSGGSSNFGLDHVSEDEDDWSYELESTVWEDSYCCSWLFGCLNLSHVARNIRSMGWSNFVIIVRETMLDLNH